MSAPAPPDGLPLTGIHVVDLTWNLPGPYATFVLSSLGARVTKVEPPRGDPARHMPRLFELVNGEKEGMVLDLRTEEDHKKLMDLVSGADVFVEGFRPGVVDRLGCGPGVVRARNPRIIYCSLSAFGQQGPRRAHPGHDLNAQALTGLCHLGRDRRGRPAGSPLPIADLSASLCAVSSILAALLARERDPRGEGATLDVAMVDAALSFAHVWSEGVDLAATARSHLPDAAEPVARHLLFERLDREGLHALPHYRTFRCRDGAWIAIGIVDESHFWRALCAEIGVPRLGRLPMPARVLLGPFLRRVVARALGRHPRGHWLERFEAADIPASAVLTPAEALDDPHLRDRLVDPSGILRSPIAGARIVRGPPPPAPVG